MIKSDFRIIVSDVRIVSVADVFVKRSRQSYGNTRAIVSNDPYVRSESFVPIERRSILASGLRDKKFCDRDDPYVRTDYMETRL